MSGKHTFRAVIKEGDGGGAYVIVPLDVERVFGKKRVQVRATFDGEPYRGSLVRMGGPSHILIVLKAIREKIGKQRGQEVEVSVEEDTTPRTVEIPPDLAAALRAEPAARTFFQALSYTQQRECVKHIEDAKRPDTRQARIGRAMESCESGRSRNENPQPGGPDLHRYAPPDALEPLREATRPRTGGATPAPRQAADRGAPRPRPPT